MQNLLEPRGDQRQYGGSYSSSDGQDKYMWNMCGPGATTAALVYWGSPVFSYAPGNFTDPHATSYWDNGDGKGRPYILYLATRSPEFSPAGLVSYGTYPSADTYATRISTALNHEINGTFYVTYLYANGQYTRTQFHDDIVTDLWYSGVAVVVGVNAQYLPNWTQQNGVTSHYIAIIGYDNTQSTWKYMDTCGPGCNNSGSSQQVNTVSQSTMWNAEVYNNGNGSLIW